MESDIKTPFIFQIGPYISGISFWGSIVAFFWLIFVGALKLAFIGIAAIFAMKYATFLLLLPQMLIASFLFSKGKEPGKVTAFLSQGYTWLIMSAWCYLIMRYFFNNGAQLEINPIPVVIWSFSVATSPICMMAYDDIKTGNFYSTIMAMYLQVAYILTIILFIFQIFPPLYSFIISSITCFLLSTLTSFKILKIEQSYSDKQEEITQINQGKNENYDDGDEDNVEYDPSLEDEEELINKIDGMLGKMMKNVFLNKYYDEKFIDSISLDYDNAELTVLRYRLQTLKLFAILFSIRKVFKFTLDQSEDAGYICDAFRNVVKIFLKDEDMYNSIMSPTKYYLENEKAIHDAQENDDDFNESILLFDGFSKSVKDKDTVARYTGIFVTKDKEATDFLMESIYYTFWDYFHDSMKIVQVFCHSLLNKEMY